MRSFFILAVSITFTLSIAQQKGPSWNCFGGNAQHTATSRVPADPIQRIKWSSPVDLHPQYSGSSLLIHYGSPLITSGGTVVFAVKTGDFNDFRVEARSLKTGVLKWTLPIDYKVSPSGWIPLCGPCLRSDGSVISPGAGGTIYIRPNADQPNLKATKLCYYGNSAYKLNKDEMDAKVNITTPLVSDSFGNVYFGVTVNASNTLGLQSSLVRIDKNLHATWLNAGDACNDQTISKPVFNAAPAVSKDGKIVYESFNRGDGFSWGGGYLVGIDTASMTPIYRAQPHDQEFPSNEGLYLNEGTASPMIGPDGDVYLGIFENPARTSHGWMSHYDKTLTTVKPFGRFGWDNTPAVVPRSAVPSYTGNSSYLLFSKYNYYGAGGVWNRIAILDPNDTQPDLLSGVPVMKEILIKDSPTYAEWCINTCAIDPFTKAAFANNEDGVLYRWDLVFNTLPESIRISGGLGEAYTPTEIAPDGTILAINNGILFAVGKN